MFFWGGEWFQQKLQLAAPLSMINGFDWWTNVIEAGKNLSQIIEDMDVSENSGLSPLIIHF